MKDKFVYRLTAGVVFVISLLQFLLTAQPSVSFWDPGELSAAAYLLQVPHPPGGPLFLIVGRFFYLLPVPGDLGFRMNLVSVLSSAFAVLFLYLVAVKLIENFRGKTYQSPVEALGTYIPAAIGALAFSFSDTFWFSGVESNYFAASTFLFAAIVWLITVWNERAEERDSGRYIVLMAYLVGLSAGVHLMSVLAIIAVVLIVGFRKMVEDDSACLTSTYLLGGHALLLLIVAALLWAGQTGREAPTTEESHAFDVRFMMAMGVTSVLYMGVLWRRIFNRNSIYLPLMIGGVALFVAYPGIIKLLPDLLRTLAGNDTTMGIIILVAILAVLGWIAYWGAKNRKTIVHIAAVSMMVAILGFTTYTMILIRANQKTPMDENDPKTFSGLVTYLNREQYGDFPIFKRRWSPEPHQQAIYTKYSSDLDFLWSYQINHMFNRYVLFNYAGRASYNQDDGVNWGQLFAIPLAMALFGLYFHFRKDWKMAMTFLILYVFMGYLIAFYQNQQEPQPREREYFYAGAYFIVAVWIAIGVHGLLDLLGRRLTAPGSRRMVMAAVLLPAVLLIPGRMFQTNLFTHDRSKNWLPWDYSYNLLQSCAPDAVLFTNGDNDTFPLWFLQDVEGVRRDVRVVCLSLLNTNWYIDQLKNREPYGTPKVAISLSNAAIEHIQPVRWEPRWLSLPVPPDVQKEYGVTDTSVERTGAVSFYMPATMQFGDVKAIRVQDIMVRDIVEQARWKRPVYFAVTCSDDSKIGLQDYLKMEGLAQRLVPQKREGNPNAEYMDVGLMQKDLFEENPGYSTVYQPGFKFRGMNDRGIFYDENQERMTLNYRYAFIRLAIHYLSAEQDKSLCLKTLDKMESVIPDDVVPMDYRVKYDIANIYYSAGGMEQFKRLAAEIEHTALAQVEKNPRDASHYYNPYGILTDIYEKTHQYDRAADLMNRLLALYPGQPEIQQQLDKFRALADTAKKDTLHK